MVDPVTGAALISPVAMRAGEKLATETTENLVDTAVSNAIHSVRDIFEAKKQKQKWDEELSRTATVFNEELQRALSTVANEEEMEQLKKITNNWENIAVKVNNIEVAYQPEEAVVDHMYQIIKNRCEEEHSGEIQYEKIRQCVETAYSIAVKEFADEVAGTELAERLNQHFNRGMMEEIQAVRDHLEFIGRYVGQYEPYTRLDPDNERFPDQLIERLSVENRSAVLDQGTPFEYPNSFDKITETDEQFVLIGGTKGVGKSRSLVEGVSKLMDSHNFKYCIVITEPIHSVDEVENITRGDFDGDILLVWDDLQKSGDGSVVRRTFQRLVNAFDNKDCRIFIRATIRKERLDSVLPRNWGLSDLNREPDPGSKTAIWNTFTPVELTTFDKPQLENYIRSSIKYHNLSADESAIQSFTDKAYETDPTPFYVDSICRTKESQLTAHNVYGLPDDGVSAWENAYNSLPDTGEYEGVKKALHSLVVLERLGAERPFNEWVVEDLFIDVFDKDGFSKSLDFLETRGWVTHRHGSSSQAGSIIIHDIRLEAVSFDMNSREMIRRGSPLREFLLGDLVGDYDHDLGAVMNSRFAQLVFAEQIGRRPIRVAKEHIEHSIRIADQPDNIYQSFINKLGTMLMDRLGIFSSKPLKDVSEIQLKEDIENSILNKTTMDYRKLRITRVRVDRISSTSLEMSVSVRYKPTEKEDYEVDQWGYVETEIQPALELHDIDPSISGIIEIFIPKAVEQSGGFGNFREYSTKTTSPIDRIMSICVPDGKEVSGNVKDLIEMKTHIDDVRTDISN